MSENSKKRICIVIQRYGTEIMGGAETYCRTYAQKLSANYDITVATTCSLDYAEWNNHYPPGESILESVRCIRFRVNKPRNMEQFAKLTHKLLSNPNHSLRQSLHWVCVQGPLSKGLIKYIKRNRSRFDLFLFMTYLYYPQVMGLGIVKDKAILVPFAHDEPYIDVKAYRSLFHDPAGIIYNTQEEMELVQRKFNNGAIPSILTGIGLDVPPLEQLPEVKEKFALPSSFILYMGRIDASKGCDKLFQYFMEYKRKHPGELKLALLGKNVIDIPDHKDIVYLGFVSDEEKYAILRESQMLVLPSQYESLSIVVLEAMYFEKPVLVNGQCQVLKGHCTKSNGGLYYYGMPDFIECLKLLAGNRALREAMGRNGRRYVDKNYRWDVILKKMEGLIDQVVKNNT